MVKDVMTEVVSLSVMVISIAWSSLTSFAGEFSNGIDIVVSLAEEMGVYTWISSCLSPVMAGCLSLLPAIRNMLTPIISGLTTQPTTRAHVDSNDTVEEEEPLFAASDMSLLAPSPTSDDPPSESSVSSPPPVSPFSSSLSPSYHIIRTAEEEEELRLHFEMLAEHYDIFTLVKEEGSNEAGDDVSVFSPSSRTSASSDAGTVIADGDFEGAEGYRVLRSVSSVTDDDDDGDDHLSSSSFLLRAAYFSNP